MARQTPGLAAAGVGRLRRAAALARREFAVDELAIVDDGHAPIVGAGYDTSAVTIGATTYADPSALASVELSNEAARRPDAPGIRQKILEEVEA
jgi:hypothetical protein